MAELRRRPSMLIVDDDPSILQLCKWVLKELDFEVSLAKSADECLRVAAVVQPDFILLDIHLPDGDGLDVLELLTQRGLARCPIVVMTGLATVDRAVRAMKLGARDFLQKPFSNSTLLKVVREQMQTERIWSGALVPQWAERMGLVGSSEKMRAVMRLVERVAWNDVTIMLYGESGTGKELVARSIHGIGSRASEPFVPVDCSALSASIIESELFGHVKGAYTGAHSDREGLFRLAGKGTIFLDEVGELPLEMQAKLLRVLQEKVVRPVGSEEFFFLEARVIAASNRELQDSVRRGQFREDLFYRLNVIPIHLPALRERREDIPELASYFVKKHASHTYEASRMSRGAIDALVAFDWQGNCRQLENVIQRAMVLCDEQEIQAHHLSQMASNTKPGNALAPDANGSLLENAERQAVICAMEQAGGNKREAARLLGISKTTLYSKLAKFGIAADRSRVPH